jgi:phage baseplate assembly protein W
MATVETTIVREYRDLDLSFNIHPVKKDINLHKGSMAVINSIKNLVLMNFYETPFQPEIGSNVRKLLFEPVDDVTAIALERAIAEVVGNYEPRARIKTVNIVADLQLNGFSVQIDFYIINQTEPVSITFFLERIR